MCLYQPNVLPCTCTFYELIRPCSQAFYFTNDNPTPVQRCPTIQFARDAGYRTRSFCTNGLALLHEGPFAYRPPPLPFPPSPSFGLGGGGFGNGLPSRSDLPHPHPGFRFDVPRPGCVPSMRGDVNREIQASGDDVLRSGSSSSTGAGAGSGSANDDIRVYAVPPIHTDEEVVNTLDSVIQNESNIRRWVCMRATTHLLRPRGGGEADVGGESMRDILGLVLALAIA